MEKILVIGAGTMGSGIAHVFAMSGFNTTIVDISEMQLQKAKSTIEKNLERQIAKGTLTNEMKSETMERLTFEINLEDVAHHSDLIIEAATEQFELKSKIFNTLSNMTASNVILATNTSSISITKLASHVKNPERVIGMHFMNPVPIMQLIEVIRGYNTSDEVCTQIMDISRKLGKTPVQVEDYYGFVSNRILMPMINEAIITLFEGVAGVDEIDTVMKLGMNHPMGPLQLADFIGLDVCYYILNVLYDGFKNPKYAPCPLLENMVLANKLGVKSGEGFYIYNAQTKEKMVSPHFLNKSKS